MPLPGWGWEGDARAPRGSTSSGRVPRVAVSKKNGARSVTGDEWEARTLRVVVLLRESRNPRKNTP